MGIEEKALKIAIKYHKGQKDKQGRDFILHPIRVAARVKSEYARTAALLHDTIEDTELTIKDLEAMSFPIEVIYAVAALTRKENETYMEYISRVKECGELAIEVKIADLEDHLEDIDELGESGLPLKKRYIKALEFLK